MYTYVGNIIGTTVPMSVGNPTDFLLNPVNKRDPTGLTPPGGDLIDGGSGTAGCPDGPYDTFQQCINDQQSQEGCYYTCFDNYVETVLPPGDEGDAVFSLGPTTECILSNLGISIATNPFAYGLCGAALAFCAVSGALTGGASLMLCVSAYATGALAACTAAGVQFAAAVAPCL